MSNVSDGSRRIAIGVVAASLVATALVLGAPVVAVAASDTPSTAAVIDALPFEAGSADDQVPYPQAGGAANATVAAECHGGQPLFGARWFRYTPTSDRSILATGTLRYEPGHLPEYVDDGVAIVDADLRVVDCGRRTGRGPASAGPVAVDRGESVYLVHYALSAFCSDPDDCIYGTPERTFRVLPAPPAPVGDDWWAAAPITRVGRAYTQDQVRATNGEADPQCQWYYEETTPSTWWTFTPAETGPLDIETEAFYPGVRLAELTADGPTWVPGPSEDWTPGCESGAGSTVEAGKTYLLTRAGSSVTINGPALGRPDLVVTSVGASPSKPKAGRPVALRATIKNRGTAPTAAGVPLVVSFEVDGTRRLQSRSFVGTLAPGASVTLTGDRGKAGARTWPATRGKHTVRAYVDRADAIDETTESNNVRSTRITVTRTSKRPDLVVTKVTARPAHPAPGAPVRFLATVRNLGAKATASGRVHSVRFSVDGRTTSWSRTRTAAIKPGRSVTLSASGGPGGRSTWEATAGSHALAATVDDRSRFTETNEANNITRVPLVVGLSASRPDLQIVGLAWTPTSAKAGSPVRFTAVVRNAGTRTVPSGAGFRVSFRPTGASAPMVTDQVDGPLAPGAIVRLTANAGAGGGAWSPARGSTDIVATVDDTGLLTESNEANNSLTVAFTRS